MKPSQISQMTAPFCPAAEGWPALAVRGEAVVAETTGLTESEGLHDPAAAAP